MMEEIPLQNELYFPLSASSLIAVSYGAEFIMDQINIKTPIPKCYLYWCSIVSRLEIQSVLLVFSTPLVN